MEHQEQALKLILAGYDLGCLRKVPLLLFGIRAECQFWRKLRRSQTSEIAAQVRELLGPMSDGTEDGKTTHPESYQPPLFLLEYSRSNMLPIFQDRHSDIKRYIENESQDSFCPHYFHVSVPQ
jgi:hypothetical protein